MKASQILHVVERNAGNPDRSVKELIGLANDRGGKDNVSTIVIEGEKFAASQGKGSQAT